MAAGRSFDGPLLAAVDCQEAGAGAGCRIREDQPIGP